MSALAQRRREDAASRELAQREFSRPVVLEAGAGTGKTTVLVARVVAWCLGPGWERSASELRQGDGREPGPAAVAADVLRGVAAITFTEAAAAEMAIRVGRALESLARAELPKGVDAEALPADPDIRRLRAQALGASLDRLGVRTIHAFCRRLLVRNPLEAGVHPRFAIDADGIASREGVREVVESHVRAAYAEGRDDGIVALATRGERLTDLEAALIELVNSAVPAADLARDPYGADALAGFSADLDGLLRGFLDAGGVRLLEAREKARKQAAAVDSVFRSADRLDHDPPRDRASLVRLIDWLREEWSDAGQRQLAKWKKGDFGKAGSAALGADQAAVSAAAAPLKARLEQTLALDPDRHDLLRTTLGPLLAEVTEVLRTRGQQTYQALLRDAAALLTQHPAVADRERGRIRQLLVDEFQDTDPWQCEVIAALALAGSEAERPGLFIVGDPKQSIYGWRNADLRAYARFLARLESAGAERLPLVVNHRSAPGVLAEVERIVAPVMQHEEGVQPSFVGLLPSEDAPVASGASVEHWIAWQWDARADAPRAPRARDASRIEAAAVARELVRLAASGVSWQEMALLFRASSDFDLYLDALREAGVPYAVAHERSFYQRREILDAAALVRCVLDPNDHLALVAWLRSASVGVPDAAWIPLWAEGLPEQMSRLRGPEPEALASLARCVAAAAAATPAVPGLERVSGWERSLLAGIESLAGLRQRFRREPADRFVEALRTASGIELSESARYLGVFRVANLERFFRELARSLEESGGDVAAVLRALRAGIADQRDEEEGRPLGAVADAVQVMTVHKAKGLGFRHVFLLQAHKGSPSSRSRQTRVVDLPEGPECVLLGCASPGYARARGQEQVREAAEQVRTLYVATTRAAERLVVSGKWGASPAGSYARLLESRRGTPPDLAAVMRDCVADRRSAFEDPDGVRWVFPELDPAARAVPRAAAADLAGLPTPEELTATVERLGRRREAAAARAARPHQHAASQDAHHVASDRQAAARFQPEGSDGIDGVATAPDAGLDRRAALAVGTAVHRVLERWRVEEDGEAEIQRGLAAVEADLAAELAESERGAASARARALLEAFARGPLSARLRALEPHVVARELPVLLPPGPEDEAVGSIAGAIDLLYRDPASGELVVADYKTDRVASDAEASALAAGYASQGRHYTRALREALALDYTPRFELWLLAAGKTVAAG